MKTKWSKKNQIHFFEKLGMYLHAQMSIDDAIKNCASGFKKRDVTVIKKIGEDISSGMNLSTSLRKEVNLSKSTIGILQVGEKSGKLSESLTTIKNLLEREDDLKKKIISSMIYPMVIGIFASLLVVGLIRGVIPQIVPMLKGLNVELPLLTKSVIAVSDIISQYGLYILSVLAVIFFVAPIIYKKIVSIRYFFHVLILKTPLIGKIVLDVALSIFSRSFGSMLSTNIGIFEAYSIAIESIDFLPLQKKMKISLTAISSGKKVSDSIAELKLNIPTYVSGLVSAGERSGTMGASLIRVADIIDRDIDHRLKRLTSLLEPALMIVMGLIIGAIALSIVMPIYDISKTLQRP